jgi:hypothetical protein
MSYPKDGHPGGDYLADRLPKPLSKSEQSFWAGALLAAGVSVLLSVVYSVYSGRLAIAHDPPRAVVRPPRVEYYSVNAVMRVDRMVFVHAWKEDLTYCPKQYVVSGDYCREFIHPSDPAGYIEVGDWVYSKEWYQTAKYPWLVTVLNDDAKIKLDLEVESK